MELECEYADCDMKKKGENLGQSIELLKIHIGAKHQRASEGQGGGGESIQKKGQTEDIRGGNRGEMENLPD